MTTVGGGRGRGDGRLSFPGARFVVRGTGLYCGCMVRELGCDRLGLCICGADGLTKKQEANGGAKMHGLPPFFL